MDVDDHNGFGWATDIREGGPICVGDLMRGPDVLRADPWAVLCRLFGRKLLKTSWYICEGTDSSPRA